MAETYLAPGGHAPGLGDHRTIELDDLLRLDDPCVIYAGRHVDADGVVSYLYTVGGWLDGRPIGQINPATRSAMGCFVGGDCIIVQAKDRTEADALAAGGLRDTIEYHRAKVRSETVDRGLNAGIIATMERRPRKR